MSERYYVMDYESKYELIDKAFPISGKDGVIAEFYVPNIAYAVCNILNKQENGESPSCKPTQWNKQGYEVVNVVNTTIPYESGKPNEWHIHDKDGQFVRAFQDRQKAYDFLNDLLKDDTALQIVNVCETIKSMLLDKNRKYGNSALEPVRVFSKSEALEQIRVRMDDKLSRIRNAQADDDEDAYMDLAGYLVLYLVARGRMKQGDDK